MPTIITHAIVPLAMAAGLGTGRIPVPVALAGAALAMLPDADVLGMRLGVEYAAQWGHRGATHSLVVAGLAAAVLALIWPAARKPWALAFLFMSGASHGLLDMLTSGGLGVALYWPFDDERLFFGNRPIRVSPIGADFFSMRGLETLKSEMLWVWAPAMLACLGALLWRMTMRRNTAR